jgi:hypothetical protein
MKRFLFIALMFSNLQAHRPARVYGGTVTHYGPENSKKSPKSWAGSIGSELSDIGKLVSFETIWGIIVLAIASCGTCYYVTGWSPMEPMAQRAGKVVLKQSTDAIKGFVKGTLIEAKDLTVDAVTTPEVYIGAPVLGASYGIYKYLKEPTGLAAFMGKIAHIRHPRVS